MNNSDDDNLIGYIAGTVETIRDDVVKIHDQMATKEDLARVEGRLSERLDASSTGIRGDIERVHLRLEGIEHVVSSRIEQVEGELSRLRSAFFSWAKIARKFCAYWDKPAANRLRNPS